MIAKKSVNDGQSGITLSNFTNYKFTLDTFILDIGVPVGTHLLGLDWLMPGQNQKLHISFLEARQVDPKGAMAHLYLLK